MSSQTFILPYSDSITGFVVLFIAATALSSWLITSSPRLSYFGMQAAVAFYLINLDGFKMQISLPVARDRVMGILLGLFIMWRVFDQLWVRLIAQFVREPISTDVLHDLLNALAAGGGHYEVAVKVTQYALGLRITLDRWYDDCGIYRANHFQRWRQRWYWIRI